METLTRNWLARLISMLAISILGDRSSTLPTLHIPECEGGLWRSLVSALVWGTRGRRFKSSQPDQFLGGGEPVINGDERPSNSRSLGRTEEPNCSGDFFRFDQALREMQGAENIWVKSAKYF